MVEIKRATAADLAEIYGLEVRCFSAPWAIEILYDDICVREHAYYILREDGIAAGYAGMDIVLDEAHIRKICVDESCRKKGYGSMLLQKMTSDAFAKGAMGIMLEVRVSNKAAQALYTSQGFTSSGVRKNYYTDKEDALILWKFRSAEDRHS